MKANFLSGSVALTLMLFTCGSSVVRAMEDLQVQPRDIPARWEFSFKGRPIMSYEMDPQKYKPYVKSLCTVDGYNILRDSPADHLHHHALMYGIKVDGINFWEEAAGSGVQRVVESPRPQISTTPEGLPQARLTQVIFWLEPQHAFLPVSNAPALLIERRTITLVVNLAEKETALHWKSQFTVGTRTNTVVLTGSNYHGLGVRFPQELDAYATHFAGSEKPDLANNRQDTSVFPWEAVSFAAPDGALTFAMFGHPANARGNARFFAMKTPFAYLSATQTLDKEPLLYSRGDRFELNYLVTVYAEAKGAAALNARYEQWAK